MVPTFNKKFNAERSAKRLAARFENVEAIGAIPNGEPGHFSALVRVPPGHPQIEEIGKLACFAEYQPAEPAPFTTPPEIAAPEIKATVDVSAVFSHQGEIAPVLATVTEAEAAEIAATGPGPMTRLVPIIKTESDDTPHPVGMVMEVPETAEMPAGWKPATEEVVAEVIAARGLNTPEAPAEAIQPVERKPRQSRMFTKKTAVLNLLARGCTNEEIRNATGWQWHTVKGFISTQRSLGRNITTTMRDGIAVYKLEG